MAYKTYSGKFSPKNPQKYKGDHNNIIYHEEDYYIKTNIFDYFHKLEEIYMSQFNLMFKYKYKLKEYYKTQI